MMKRTDELKPGNKVLLAGRIVRTVNHIENAGYEGMTGLPVRHVFYVEGRTSEWSVGNSAVDSTEWTLA